MLEKILISKMRQKVVKKISSRTAPDHINDKSFTQIYQIAIYIIF